jgi:hypothetical protein
MRPGTLVRVPTGWTKIEEMRRGDPVIVASTSGDVAGWTGGYKVLQAHVYDYDEELVTLSTGQRSVEMTVRHRVPVKMDESARYFTYMMVRNGVYRVGYMSAYCHAGMAKNGDDEWRFMLSQRCELEGADAAWILKGHATRAGALSDESVLLGAVKGTTFNQMDDARVAVLEPQTENAVALLREHGRRVEFPFWRRGIRQDFKARYPFVTEACNVMGGMRVAELDDGLWDDHNKGRSRQKFAWNPATIQRRLYMGKIHGLIVPPIAQRPTYSRWPLFFAGDGVLVLNAAANAMEQITAA